MRTRLSVLISLLFALNLCSKVVSAQMEDYEIGNNVDFVFGVDFLNTFQINPKATGGENNFDAGTKLDFEFVNFDLKQILEFRILLDLNAQKVDDEEWKKNADRLELSLKYGIKPRYGSKIYYSSDMSIRTQLLKGYMDDYLFKQTVNSMDLTSALLSPANITLSAGLEYRPQDRSTYFYFSPLALNLKYVKNDTLAQRIVTDVEGDELGPLHGNDIGKNTRTRVGAQLKLRYDVANLNETISWDTYLDMFLAYSEFFSDANSSPVQIEWVNSLSFRVWRPIVFSIDVRATYDPDLLFVDLENEGNYTSDKSYNMLNRILLSFSTKYFIGQ